MNRFVLVLASLLVFSMIISRGEGVCQQVKKGSGELCSHNGNTYAIGDEWKLDYPDCMICKCDRKFFSCCGYGIHGGVFTIPEGQRLVPDQCDIEFEPEEQPETSHEESCSGN